MSYPLKKAGIGATIGLAVLLVAAVTRQSTPPVPGDTYRTAPGVESSRAYVLASDNEVAAADIERSSDAVPADAPGAADQERTPAVTEAPDGSTPIVVSSDKRWLWYIAGQDTIMSVPVAVGMNRGFEFAGRSFHCSAPRGTRRVLAKETAPVWTVPEWHYYERARNQGLEIVKLTRDSRIDLSDGTVVVVRGDD